MVEPRDYTLSEPVYQYVVVYVTDSHLGSWRHPLKKDVRAGTEEDKEEEEWGVGYIKEGIVREGTYLSPASMSPGKASPGPLRLPSNDPNPRSISPG